MMAFLAAPVVVDSGETFTTREPLEFAFADALGKVVLFDCEDSSDPSHRKDKASASPTTSL